jgi:ADP-ribosyl-[dinitrogen reductase] hydrolase
MHKDRLKGCLIYGAIGDAIGNRFEGSNEVKDFDVDFRWFISDDTQLTLATCEAIYNCKNINPETIAMKFLDWFNTRRLTGLGSSTLKALRELQVGGHWALVGNSGERAAGNGGAMRIAPLAFKRTMERITIKDVCSITHKNDEAYTGALAIYYAVVCAHTGNWTGGTDLIENVTKNLPDTNVRERLTEFSKLKDRSIEDIGKLYPATGYVVDSVPVSIFAAQQIGKLSVQAIFRELIQIGGDTDTICSMAGQIIGSLIGSINVPKEWSSKFNSDLKDVRESIDLIVDQWQE